MDLESLFILVLESVGTFAFAISGVRLASAKNFDLFGAYVVGLCTAIGGGTIRDLLLDVPPFWMLNSLYMFCTGAALLLVFFFSSWLVKLKNTFFIFDTIGLGLFTVVGIEKTLALGFPFWVAIVMGTITGAAGGILRDVFINEIPLIFRKEIYALACVVGGLVYWLSLQFNFDGIIAGIAGATAVILCRVIAVRFEITLPILQGNEDA
ncbi:MAG: trimeric intracellular cation channel family protein [Prevotellaceae bacterium]|jgi:uncharacterized membrane protein YeiH|nr:trimeric intracellular cation channel family protein [Prevotellaceae bacterium]